MKDDRFYLIHIRDTIARINKYTKSKKKKFFGSELVQDAAVRNLQVLAESTQRLSDDFKRQHPQIDWQGMAGFRNVLVHSYTSIDLARVWDVIKQRLPELESQLRADFRTLPEPPRPKRKKKAGKRTKRSKKRKS